MGDHVDDSEIEALRSENERLQAMVDGDFKKATEIRLREAGPGPDGSFHFDLQATIVPLIVEELAQTFKRMGGENYVSIEVNHDELGPLMLTLQRRLGETPAQKAARLAAEVAALKSVDSKPLWRLLETATLGDGEAVLLYGRHTQDAPPGASHQTRAGDHWWCIGLYDIWRTTENGGQCWVFAKDGQRTWSEPTHWMPIHPPRGADTST